MATNWTNAEARPYYLYLRGRIQTNLGAVMSETQEDLIVFDTEYYRDEIDAAFMGTGRTVQISKTGGGAWIVTNGEQEVLNGTTGSDTYTFAPGSDGHLEESDSFNHVPPHPLSKTRSRLYWWSGTPDDSNVVGSAWADQVIACSPNQYTSGF